ncbi:MAG: hypothetical protein P9X24_17625 [Candidatus Hatepunaea meridiana]|nr:hypothetical protein [Candidatus Hatepunaea meridiana]
MRNTLLWFKYDNTLRNLFLIFLFTSVFILTGCPFPPELGESEVEPPFQVVVLDENRNPIHEARIDLERENGRPRSGWYRTDNDGTRTIDGYWEGASCSIFKTNYLPLDTVIIPDTEYILTKPEKQFKELGSVYGEYFLRRNDLIITMGSVYYCVYRLEENSVSVVSEIDINPDWEYTGFCEKGDLIWYSQLKTGISALDISDPMSPFIAENYFLPGELVLYDVHDTLFVFGEDNRYETPLYIYKKSGDNNLEWISNLPHDDVNKLRIIDNSLLIVTGSELICYDITNLQHPNIVFLEEFNEISQCWFFEDRLEFTTPDPESENCCYLVYDISNPAQPVLIERMNLPFGGLIDVNDDGPAISLIRTCTGSRLYASLERINNSDQFEIMSIIYARRFMYMFDNLVVFKEYWSSRSTIYKLE